MPLSKSLTGSPKSLKDSVQELSPRRPLKAFDAEALGQAAECLRTLAHPVRIRIAQLLLHDRYTVGEIAEGCGVAENVASEHLRLMQRCGFFASDREGRRVYYRVAEPHLHRLLDCIEGRFQP